jgi:hypothetical protein
MNQSLSAEEVVSLTRRVAVLYAQEDPRQSFGAWVLDRFYPNVDRYNLVNARELHGASRTFDARMYLSGMLTSGCLSPQPLYRALENVVITDRELAYVI